MRYAIDHRHLSPSLEIEIVRPKIVAPPPRYKPMERSANFVLVKLATGSQEKVLNVLRSLNGLSGIHPVYGEYDVVLIIRENSDVDKHLLVENIRTINGVVGIKTLIAAAS